MQITMGIINRERNKQEVFTSCRGEIKVNDTTKFRITVFMAGFGSFSDGKGISIETPIYSPKYASLTSLLLSRLFETSLKTIFPVSITYPRLAIDRAR